MQIFNRTVSRASTQVSVQAQDGASRKQDSKITEFLSIGILFPISFAIVAYRFYLVSGSNTLEWDSASFLTNAGTYAGLSQFSQAYDPTRPPLIPLLISLGFRIFGPTQVVGYVVSSGFYFLAIFGAYLLARQLVNPGFALMASFSFAFAPAVFAWSGLAISDVEGTGIASIALATFIMATKGNHKLYLVALPLFVLTFFTRYALGAILVVGIVYLIASKKYDEIFDPYEFYYGVGLSVLVLAAVSFQWISYPFVNHETLRVLFPQPGAVNPFQSSLGAGFFVLNLPSELGNSTYGYLLLAFLIIGIAYIATNLIFPANIQSISAPLALAVWFGFMLGYYSLFWPYADIRYSIEFLMPATIISFWALSLGLESIFNWGRKSGHLKLIATISLISLSVAVVGFAEIQGINQTLYSNPVLETDLNVGMRQALGWVGLNVPKTDKLESNWYTLVWWYAPQYNTTAAPLDYQLASNADYANWVHALLTNNIHYVVYVDPQNIQIPVILEPAFTSNVGNGTTVVVYRVV